MTALTGLLSRQLERTTHSTRRLRVLMVPLVAIAFVGIVLIVQRYPAARAVQYNTSMFIEPVPSALCHGESFTYNQAISVGQIAMVTVSRDWCNRGFTCHLELHESWPNVVLTPLFFSGPVTRTIPISPFFKPGGLYEFRSGVRNGELSVQIVEFSIRDDCEVNP